VVAVGWRWVVSGWRRVIGGGGGLAVGCEWLAGRVTATTLHRYAAALCYLTPPLLMCPYLLVPPR
jgi:hypothetical protein